MFDLSRGPLLRVKVLKLKEEEHIALFTMHHIVSDGWLIGVFVREVCNLYGAISEGKRSPLPELEIQYADYAYWQRQYLTGAVLEEHLGYWKKQLAGNLPVLNLPADHLRPAVPSYRGSTISFSLPPELSQSLRALSRKEGATLFMTMLAAFNTLLSRYTGQEDIVIGSSLGSRSRVEIEPLIGYFINMLPMRTDLSGNPIFRDLLRRVKEAALSGYAHQEIPFEKLVEEAQPERTIRQAPLFNVVFGVQNAPGEDASLQGIKITPVDTGQEISRFDLTLWVTENTEETQLSWTYSKDLFEEATIIRIHDHFEALLFSIVDRPDARLTNLEISPKAEIRPSRQAQDGQAGSDVKTLLSSKRRGVRLTTEPV